MARKFFALLALAPLFFLSSCSESARPQTESQFRPILMERSQLENSIKVADRNEPAVPGKIYSKGDYLFIGDQYTGVHVYNNSNPSNPVHMSFIQIPGCMDMAMQGNFLYVDNATDLVTIDLSNPTTPRVADRKSNTFPALLPPDGLQLADEFQPSRWPANTVCVGWERIDK